MASKINGSNINDYTDLLQQSLGLVILTFQPLLNKFLSLSVFFKLVSAFTAYAILYILLYLPIRFIYRAYFDPLSRIPGPKWVLVSEMFNKFYWLILPGPDLGQLHLRVKEYHEQYGPIVRTGPRTVSFNDIDVYNQIYKINTKFAKSSDFYEIPAVSDSLAHTSNIREATARRAAFAPYFSKQAVRKLEGTIQSKVSLLLDQIQSIQRDIVLDRAFRCLTADVITNYSYAKDFDALSHPAFQPEWLLAFEGLIDTLGLQLTFPRAFSGLRYLVENVIPPSMISPTMKSIMDFLHQCKNAVLTQRDSYLKGERDMVSIFRNLFEDDEKKGRRASTAKELEHDAVSTVSAGLDTTGHALTLLVYYMVKNPDVEKMLLEELKGVMKSPRADVMEEVLDKLPVLNAVIKETLRFSHGVPGPLPRDVPPGGVTFHNHYLPACTMIYNFHYIYHTNPDIFPNPMKWNPSRWLIEDTREMEKYLMTFSKGSRMCIGINLASSELLITTARLIRRYEIGFEEGFKEEDMQWNAVFLPVTKGRLRVWVKEREE